MPPDAGGTFLTKHSVIMAWFRHELTDVVVCCTQPRGVSEPGTKNTLHSGTAQTTSYLNRMHDHREMQHLTKMLDPIQGGPATGKSVAGIINLFVDDLSGTGGTVMEQRVLARRRRAFHVGSEDWNDVLVTRQRIRRMKCPQLGPSIEVIQERASRKEHERRSPLYSCNAYQVQMPSRRDKLVAEWDTVSVLLHVFQMRFNGSFSNIGDVKALNKLARQFKSKTVKLQLWPLTRPLRTIGFLDASYRNNEDAIFTERHDSILSRVTRAFLEGWNVIWKSC